MSVGFYSKGRWSSGYETSTVTVQERRGKVRVEWDYYRLPEVNDEFFRKHASEITQEIQDLMNSYRGHRYAASGTGLVGYVDGFPIDISTQLAYDVAEVFKRFANLRSLE
ncbi:MULTISPECIES: hypothetical protein [unclassified Pseudomonas]|uniref:hypothetical protein n=1 Tax=unclassified Pseudomonas TaxID=196821 RepID=UPI000BDB39B3|nr:MULTISPECIES: hypothetical protein [unclassified Pseudomonas]PVZ19965.1 hypothetical protein F474_00556 [Pseudomonas sp. URIL14HWK12:I12]PVZ27031.1 hypothetical protein F470_00211 [Pseudomonas sp. URIL14HWK12:I10]PVZ37920.1 hypothetical protein F472_00556 [Pseudomonas sp. URIL14HWK12:I11]SNZ05139.1 hypothetical protein SAMN05660463_00848 [Pseudomonas sp. URIL14HWK12:I9]